MQPGVLALNRNDRILLPYRKFGEGIPAAVPNPYPADIAVALLPLQPPLEFTGLFGCKHKRPFRIDNRRDKRNRCR
ncbi:hypothetical protein D3C74_435730 [compost metagenome]